MNSRASSSDSRTTLVFLFLVEFAVLAVAYVVYVYPQWSYMGFQLAVNYSYVALSCLLISVFAVVGQGGNPARSYFLNIATMICIIPALVLYAVGGQPTHYMLSFLAGYLIVFVTSMTPFPPVVFANISPRWLIHVVVIAVGALIASYVALGGLQNFNLDIRLVYDFREEAEKQLPGIFGYISPIVSKVLIPFGVSVSIFYRKYIYVIILVFSSILVFGFTSHKAAIFYPFVSIVIYFGLSRSGGGFSVILKIAILAISLSAFDGLALEYFGSDGVWGWFSNLFTRRVLFVPALLNYFYIDFFSDNSWYLWSSSRLSMGLSTSPYDLTAPYLIGEIYLGSAATGANTGFIGSGYAQAGFGGMVFYSIGVGLTIAIISAYHRRLGLPLIAAVTTNLVFVMFASTDFVALFLTHGMLLAFLLLSSTLPQQASGPAVRKSPSRSGGGALVGVDRV